MKTTTLFLFLSLINLHVFAQGKPYDEVSLASPNVAALGKYADIPVNTHTGIPQIGFPIYTIKDGPIELPVGLSYHASGIKVSELASWVGLGWSLNAGGMITRVVQGVPDERGTTTGLVNDTTHLSHKGFYNYLIVDNVIPPFGKVADIAAFEGSHKDGEPDMFFFNFASYTGKFFFNDDGKPVLLPEGDIKIEYNYSGSGSINNFTLTPPDGTRYYFGRTAAPVDIDPVEITHIFDENGYNGSNNVINTWYLNRVESSDGLHVITFSYTLESYRYFALSSFPVAGVANRAYEYKLIQHYVQGVRLASISFVNGTITFEPSSAARQDLLSGTSTVNTEVYDTTVKSLGTIRIQNTMGDFCKRFTFSYGYFDDNTTSLRGYISNRPFNSDRKRLKLESIAESSCDSASSVPPTTFDYYTEPLPRRLSFATDHWGFNNGATTNNQLIPTYTINEFITINGANRASAYPAMRAASLKRIIYPTGGYTDFEFEANTTWVSTTAYNNVLTWQGSMGFDGGMDPIKTNVTFTSNPSTFYIENIGDDGEATVKINNISDGTMIRIIHVDPNSTQAETVTLIPGSYEIELFKAEQSSTSGDGVALAIYEKQPYSVNENRIVGGLRVKSITYHDGISSNDKRVDYSYDVNGRSSGVLYSRPTYVQLVRNDILKEYGVYNMGDTTIANCYTYGCAVCQTSSMFPYLLSPNSIRPMETSQGNHIGYNEVRVSQTNNGHTIYRHYGSDRWDSNTGEVCVSNVNINTCDLSSPNFPAAPPEHEFKRGELKYEGHFDEAGQLLKETYYYYNYEDNPLTTPALITASFVNSVNQVVWGQPFTPGAPGTFPNGESMYGLTTFYEIKTARKTSARIEERICTPGGACHITTTDHFFESPYHHQLTRSVTSGSNGDTLETKIKYAADFRLSNCDNFSQCYQEYNNGIAGANSQLHSGLSACGQTNQFCRFWKWQEILQLKSQVRKAYLSCRENLFNSEMSCRSMAKANADPELKPVTELQDKNKLVPIETTQWRNGNLVSATYNKFDYSTAPANEIYLSRIQLLHPTTLSTTFTNAAVSGNSVTKDSRYQQETNIQFRNGNISELTKKDGIVTTYVWGYNNTYPVAKIEGASLQEVSGVSLSGSILNNPANDQQLRQELDKIRQQLSNAFVSTYTYSPHKGMTSETDPNGRTSFYEYDSLGRLHLLRDKDGNIVKTIEYHYQNQ